MVHTLPAQVAGGARRIGKATMDSAMAFAMQKAGEVKIRPC
jgi:hypothetical protein